MTQLRQFKIQLYPKMSKFNVKDIGINLMLRPGINGFGTGSLRDESGPVLILSMPLQSICLLHGLCKWFCYLPNDRRREMNKIKRINNHCCMSRVQRGVRI